MDRVRIALIGCGGIAKGHISAYQGDDQNQNVRLEPGGHYAARRRGRSGPFAAQEAVHAR